MDPDANLDAMLERALTLAGNKSQDDTVLGIDREGRCSS